MTQMRPHNWLITSCILKEFENETIIQSSTFACYFVSFKWDFQQDSTRESRLLRLQREKSLRTTFKKPNLCKTSVKRIRQEKLKSH